MSATVKAVSKSASHSMHKTNAPSIMLLAGLGVEGDAHMGTTVKHRSRVKQDPDQPNLRQVHLIHAELHEELRAAGFELSPGQMGENITSSGLNLLELPKNTQLLIGATAIVEVTGLRNPCVQLDGIQEGLMKAVLDRDENGALIRKAGIMGIVVQGGVVNVGDEIRVRFPEGEYLVLEPV